MTAGAPARARAALPGLPALLAELGRAPERDPTEVRLARARPGDVVGRFELLRELGRGGFGVVFEARDRARGRSVAIKLARPGPRVDTARASLAREAALGHLRHPNVHVALEGGRCEKGPFVVLERLAGETLAARLARGPLPLRDAVEVAAAVAAALRHVHAHGIVHRDVKPANVFLPRGGPAKLLDFGLASVDGRGGPRGSGTSRYMSPEQRSGGPEDARTDLFALGRLVGEMARGVARALPELDALAGALVERDPARRPSAAAALARLRGMRRGLGARAHGDHPTARLRRGAGGGGPSPEDRQEGAR